MAISWGVSNDTNWLGCVVGGWFGTGRATTIASGGFAGHPLTELAVALSLWGPRPGKPAEPDTV